MTLYIKSVINKHRYTPRLARQVREIRGRIHFYLNCFKEVTGQMNNGKGKIYSIIHGMRHRISHPAAPKKEENGKPTNS